MRKRTPKGKVSILLSESFNVLSETTSSVKSGSDFNWLDSKDNSESY